MAPYLVPTFITNPHPSGLKVAPKRACRCCGGYRQGRCTGSSAPGPVGARHAAAGNRPSAFLPHTKGDCQQTGNTGGPRCDHRDGLRKSQSRSGWRSSGLGWKVRPAWCAQKVLGGYRAQCGSRGGKSPRSVLPCNSPLWSASGCTVRTQKLPLFDSRHYDRGHEGGLGRMGANFRSKTGQLLADKASFNAGRPGRHGAGSHRASKAAK